MRLNQWEIKILEKFYINYEQDGYSVLDISGWKKELGLNYQQYSSILNHLFELGYISHLESIWDSGFYAQITKKGIEYLNKREIDFKNEIMNNSWEIIKKEDEDICILKFKYKNNSEDNIKFTKDELLEIKGDLKAVNSIIIYDWCRDPKTKIERRPDIMKIINKAIGNNKIFLPLAEFINNDLKLII